MNSMRRQRIGGVLLLASVALALLLANTPLADGYHALAGIEAFKEVALFLFFLNVGIEIRHEIRDGILSNARKAAVPFIAAVCGMLVPVAIFSLLNIGKDEAAGWPIVMSFDVAFALAVLGIAGRWLSSQARAFVLTVAVIDDSLAILVLALVFASSFNPLALTSLAAIAVGILVPGLHRLRPQLEPAVGYIALPVFGFLSAGVTFEKLTGGLNWWLAISIVLAIVIGKPLGVNLGAWLAVKSKLGKLAEGITFKLIRRISMVFALCFTIPLMMSELAFATNEQFRASSIIAIVSLVIVMTFIAVLSLERAKRKQNK